QGDNIIEEWRSLIKPDRPIPHNVSELTGIHEEDVQREGITLQEAIHRLQKLIGKSSIVGHNINFDLSFFKAIEKSPDFLTNPRIDTFELATILMPSEGSYALDTLAKKIGIDLSESHRALSDARTAMKVYLKLFEYATRLPPGILNEIIEYANKCNWPLAEFWREVQEYQTKNIILFNQGSIYNGVLNSYIQKDDVLIEQRRRALMEGPLEPKPQTQKIDLDQISKILAEDGPFATRFPGYEKRQQQIQMLQKVSKIFNDKGVGLIEAGTGVGKSLAYLIPAMIWSQKNGDRVVISTNTINLQEQLAFKDVPTVIDILGGGRAAVMKGKGRYLCKNRFDEVCKNGPQDVDEARLMARILIWLTYTITGDGDELIMSTPGERAFFQRVSAKNNMCNMKTCSESGCFFYQARKLAESANVIIVNHALLLADLLVENNVLPEYEYLIIDEAHHLEAAATESLTIALDFNEIKRTFGELSRIIKSVQNIGFNPVITYGDEYSGKKQPDDILQQCQQAAEAVSTALESSSVFFDEMKSFAQNESQEDSFEYVRRVRITQELRKCNGWTRIKLSCDTFKRDLDALVRQLNGIANIVSEYDKSINNVQIILNHLNGNIRFITETSEYLHKLLSDDNDQYVWWIDLEKPHKITKVSRVTLNAAPLHIGPILQRELWQKKRAVILTSATLRTSTANDQGKQSFNYIQKKLDINNAETIALGSPFDYKSSTLLYIVNDIPEPNHHGYQQALERGLVELFSASHGRGLALFTSYSALHTTAQSIAPILQNSNITVLEQGDGTSRRKMIENFRSAERAVMLGTKSFWEGVDIQGEKLTALAICRLPFEVPTNPVFVARSERLSNPFNDYSVPEAVLRFKQGFGRLIRSKNDYGVVVIFDRRILTKNYGRAFLNALPETTVMRGTIAQMGRIVRDWLSLKSAARINSEINGKEIIPIGL
ncbi:MAG: exonuclease domain-containing protein, partial [Methylacidiphilales bacterium]|nr:exonuclease domain-containing protein [Candidatus Methylacidiphilales bacterium]